MKTYFKSGAIAIVITLVIGGLILFINKLLFSNDRVAEVQDKPTVEQQLVIDTQWDAVEVINDNELETSGQVMVMIHEMANTKIIAQDGAIWGLKSITKQRVERVQKAIKDLKVEDTQINEMLNRWGNQDFSQCVSEHNYIWSKYLHGNVGKAVKLR